MKNAPEVLVEAFEDAKEVAETATQNGLITPKRLIVAAGVALAVAGTVILVKRYRAAKDEAALEAAFQS